ncbi:MAG: CDP-glucose 4,6-dehydratase [Terracidiphilus sp.]
MGRRQGALEDMVRSEWKNRRVFLTGHTGFKGSWLSLWLKSLGAKVHGYALPPESDPNLFTAARVADCVEHQVGDIRNLAEMERSIAAFKPEVVFHMAAQPLVRRSYANPIETYSTNVMGTAHLLDAIRRVPSVRAVVVVTTDKCYENREWLWGYREVDRLGGFDPYSNSKACAELVTAAYRNSYFPPARFAEHKVALASARAGNVIGGGDWSEDRLIPDLIRGCLSGKPVKIRNPRAIRPWQHVLEPLAGYIALAEHLLRDGVGFAGAWNFGPAEEDAWPVGRIADAITAAWGNGAAWVQDTVENLHEAGYLKLDVSKARALLGWCPVLPIDISLRWLVEWFVAWRQGEDMQAFTLRQIAEYQGLLLK